MHTTAIFFDGKSSASRTVELQVEERFGEFKFTPKGESPIVWQLEDIRHEKYGSSLEIKNDKESLAFLQINDAEFIKQFLLYLKYKNKIGVHDSLRYLGFKKHIVIAVAVFAFMVFGYIFIIPIIAEKAVVIIPETFDNYLGGTFMLDYMTQNSIDSKKTETLNEFAQQLELNNARPLEFTVVESSIVNAFALPNGSIILYTGLLNKMQGYEELAGLIGHEVMHVNERHSIKTLCRNLASYIFISAILSDVDGIMVIIAENAHSLNSLSFSRKFEREADHGGTSIMIQNEIDPNGMLRLFERLQEDDPFVVPEFFSSHPVTKNRMEYIKKYIKSQKYESKHNDVLSDLFLELKN